MERIRLTKDEKYVLQALLHNKISKDIKMLNYTCDTYALQTLEQKLFVKLDYCEEDTITRATLTAVGYEYMRQNPHLYNPIDWWLVIATVCSALSTIASTANLIVSLITKH